MNFDPSEEYLILSSADLKLMFTWNKFLPLLSMIYVYLNNLKFLFLVYYILISKFLLAPLCIYCFPNYAQCFSFS